MKTIADMLFLGDTLGTREIGVEIEAEGDHLPMHAPMGWRVEYDGSLRGESYEYVFTNPVPRDKVEVLLGRLDEKFKEKGSEVFDSGRAGIHVHVNIRDLTKAELYNFICLYIIFEDILVKWCGELREGNLFCLRIKDADHILQYLSDSLRTDCLEVLYDDNIRYASMNCKAICQYGSLEFRAMRSTIDMEVIHQWVNLLLALKDKAKTFDNPRKVIDTMSWEGPEAFAKATFGDMLSSFPDNTDWRKSVIEGIRRAQNVAYAIDWKEVKND